MEKLFLISCNLRKIRSQENLRQWELSVGSGIALNRISFLERGAPPTSREVEKITSLLGVSPSEIWPHLGR